MNTLNFSTSSLIQHEAIAHLPAKSKVAVGPKTRPNAPQIKLHRDGDKVESIEIQCQCGEVIVIQCDYQ